jgi:3-dehydroquinate synthase
VDSNTHNDCLSIFLAQLEFSMALEIIEIEPGEVHKTIETCLGVWNALSELNADRKSLIINLGGGVVTDLGGFVASTFKRGLKYINVPTSLLAMVDASVGGKTGVDLGVLKNQVGVVNFSEMVLIDTQFLETLPQAHLRSGLAEMLKHGLITDQPYWDQLSNLKELTYNDLDDLIYRSVEIKNKIVTQDPNENGQRKTLNFGHTLGHAIESYFLSDQNKEDLLHGEAIAIGMVLAAYISTKVLNFSLEEAIVIKSKIDAIYTKVHVETQDYAPIIELLKYDKKNSFGNINFVLLSAIGSAEIDLKVDNKIILEAFDFYEKA